MASPSWPSRVLSVETKQAWDGTAGGRHGRKPKAQAADVFLRLFAVWTLDRSGFWKRVESNEAERGIDLEDSSGSLVTLKELMVCVEKRPNPPSSPAPFINVFT